MESMHIFIISLSIVLISLLLYHFYIYSRRNSNNIGNWNQYQKEDLINYLKKDLKIMKA